MGVADLANAETILAVQNGTTDKFTILGDGKVNHVGFTVLGSGAPSIKMKKLTGVTGASENDQTDIAHGLTRAKIIGCQVLIQGTSNNIPPAFTDTAELEYYFFISDTNVSVMLHPSNSGNLLSKAITVLITYEE